MQARTHLLIIKKQFLFVKIVLKNSMILKAEIEDSVPKNVGRLQDALNLENSRSVCQRLPLIWRRIKGSVKLDILSLLPKPHQ